MRNTKLLTLIFAILMIAQSCKTDKSSVNLEMVGFESNENLMAPGLGTLGIIDDHRLFVFYLTETPKWIMDKVSQFNIPPKNQGLMALGMGIIGVVDNDVMHFYYLGAEGEWKKDQDVLFVLPEKFERVSCMRLPWELGFIALEKEQGYIDFYYLNEDARWLKDETARFTIPRGTENYIMLGSMQIGIISEGRLLVYLLTEEGEWESHENMTLKLPEYDALMSYESGVIGILKDDLLKFYAMDSEKEIWIYDDTMDFVIPEKLE